MILGVVLASAMSSGVLADAPTESAYSDILNTTDGDGTSSNPHVVTTLDELRRIEEKASRFSAGMNPTLPFTLHQSMAQRDIPR